MSLFLGVARTFCAAGPRFARAGSVAWATSSRDFSQAVEDGPTSSPSESAPNSGTATSKTQDPSPPSSSAGPSGINMGSPDQTTRAAGESEPEPTNRPLASAFNVKAHRATGQNLPQIRNKQPYKNTLCRAVLLLNLNPSVTLSDITQAIAQTAPVGRVLDVRKKFGPYVTGKGAAAATILLHSDDAAFRLYQAARAGVFRVNGESPYVTMNHSREIPQQTACGPLNSRVMELRGPRKAFTDVTEETIREMLLSDKEAMMLADSHLLDSEPVQMLERGDGMVRMLWPFFSDKGQARPYIKALRRKLGQLWIGYGPDPCYNPEWGTPLSRKYRRYLRLKFKYQEKRREVMEKSSSQ